MQVQLHALDSALHAGDGLASAQKSFQHQNDIDAMAVVRTAA